MFKQVENRKELGKALQTIRTQCGVSQNTLGNHLGLLNGQAISNIERGLLVPSVLLFEGYAKACNVPTKQVFEIFDAICRVRVNELRLAYLETV